MLHTFSRTLTLTTENSHAYLTTGATNRNVVPRYKKNPSRPEITETRIEQHSSDRMIHQLIIYQSIHTSSSSSSSSFRFKAHEMVVLVVALVERWTRDRKVTGSTPGRALSSQLGPLSLPSLRGR